MEDRENNEIMKELPLKQRLFYRFNDSRIIGKTIGPIIHYGGILLGGPYPKDFFDSIDD
jgi:hypothetical protein